MQWRSDRGRLCEERSALSRFSSQRWRKRLQIYRLMAFTSKEHNSGCRKHVCYYISRCHSVLRPLSFVPICARPLYLSVAFCLAGNVVMYCLVSVLKWAQLHLNLFTLEHGRLTGRTGHRTCAASSNVQKWRHQLNSTAAGSFSATSEAEKLCPFRFYFTCKFQKLRLALGCLCETMN